MCVCICVRVHTNVGDKTRITGCVVRGCEDKEGGINTEANSPAPLSHCSPSPTEQGSSSAECSWECSSIGSPELQALAGFPSFTDKAEDMIECALTVPITHVPYHPCAYHPCAIPPMCLSPMCPITHVPYHPLCHITHVPYHSLCPITHVPYHSLCPITHVPYHPCALSPMCPITHVPYHPCALSPMCPITHVPYHPCALSPMCPITHCATSPMCPITHVPYHPLYHITMGGNIQTNPARGVDTFALALSGVWMRPDCSRLVCGCVQTVVVWCVDASRL